MKVETKFQLGSLVFIVDPNKKIREGVVVMIDINATQYASRDMTNIYDNVAIKYKVSTGVSISYDFEVSESEVFSELTAAQSKLAAPIMMVKADKIKLESRIKEILLKQDYHGE